jgi:hypothetical protein
VESKKITVGTSFAKVVSQSSGKKLGQSSSAPTQSQVSSEVTLKSGTSDKPDSKKKNDAGNVHRISALPPIPRVPKTGKQKFLITQ